MASGRVVNNFFLLYVFLFYVLVYVFSLSYYNYYSFLQLLV